jgi:hypothetical protein
LDYCNFSTWPTALSEPGVCGSTSSVPYVFLLTICICENPDIDDQMPSNTVANLAHCPSEFTCSQVTQRLASTLCSTLSKGASAQCPTRHPIHPLPDWPLCPLRLKAPHQLQDQHIDERPSLPQIVSRPTTARAVRTESVFPQKSGRLF